MVPEGLQIQWWEIPEHSNPRLKTELIRIRFIPPHQAVTGMAAGEGRAAAVVPAHVPVTAAHVPVPAADADVRSGMIKLSAEKLHIRYKQQAEWTRPFREYLFAKLQKCQDLNILEVGCGTGAVISDIKLEYADKINIITGVDIDYQSLLYAEHNKCTDLIQADGSYLPFADSCFDLAFCHYLLLWVPDPSEILSEMKRVIKPGGICAAMAEPCYKEMTASPRQLYALALRQQKELADSGADINIGNKLPRIFEEAGFSEIEFGKYRDAEIDSAFIHTEISQMLLDTGIKDFEPDPKVKYAYSVPTYFAFAGK